MGFLERWARFFHRRRGRVIGVWALIVVAMLVAQSMFGESSSPSSTTPEPSPSARLTCCATASRSVPAKTPNLSSKKPVASITPQPVPLSSLFLRMCPLSRASSDWSHL